MRGDEVIERRKRDSVERDVVHGGHLGGGEEGRAEETGETAVCHRVVVGVVRMSGRGTLSHGATSTVTDISGRITHPNLQ